ISHLYLSPVLTARTGSTHGYDVVDPTKVSPALGGEQGLRTLADRAHGAGLGVICDIVPNHLGIGADNPLWEDLLTHGQGGEGARFFDVDWNPPLPGARGKVILPVLGDQYGAVLHRGDLTATETERGPRLRYFEHSFPLSDETREAVGRAGGVTAFAGTPGEPETWHRLHALLESQHYRLVSWRVGDAVVNYRRFFAINELAGVRVEDDAVFDRTHDKVLQLVDDGVIDGLRVDHPDGLRDPTRYLERLAERSGGVWTVVEKITHSPDPARPEPLPDWPVAGTTGYDFCNDVVGLYVDPAAEQRFDLLAWGQDLSLGTGRRGLVDDAKMQILDADLNADFERLAWRVWALAQVELSVRDYTAGQWSWFLSALLVSLDVYRTYVDPQTGAARAADADVLDRAFATARFWDVDNDVPSLRPWLRSVLLGEAGDSPGHLDFIARFQQLSSALMAKGAEDTAFYRDRRLLALNEVGGDPVRFGIDVAAFHDANAERARRHPAGMLTTATHDTKRGEDVRLRIAALTELPEGWGGCLTGWRQRGWVDEHTLDLICQTLVGVWPLDGQMTPALTGRVKAYLTKALREAGEETDWLEPDDEFEAEVHAGLDEMLDDGDFLAEMAQIATAAQEIAMVSGLSQVLLRCTAPGVCDTYQGNELWDDSLVDPDNRRPVDFAGRRRLLAELGDGPDAEALWTARRDGRVKLWVLTQALRVRRGHPHAFGADAGYEPLVADGRWADHVVGYARTDADGEPRIVAVALRLPGAIMGPDLRSPLGEVFDATTLQMHDGDWDEVLTGHRGCGGGTLPLADVLTELPVGLLVRRGS
ncbi:MAG: malto-oligosyltrehalose synthase, partial [Egibacteraceae bacterium]